MGQGLYQLEWVDRSIPSENECTESFRKYIKKIKKIKKLKKYKKIKYKKINKNKNKK